MRRDTIDTYCPWWPCPAALEIERFDGRCRCWHCGQAVKAVHDCCPGDEEWQGECYDYAEADEGQ